LAAPVKKVVIWGPDRVALPPAKVAELPVPPMPLHIKDPRPPPPLAAADVASGVNVDPSTTSTDEDAARLYVVPPIVAAGPPGVSVTPAITTGARLVPGARGPVEGPTTGVECTPGAVLAAFPVVTALFLAGVDGLLVELEVDCA
jgi:hypothetical protein